MSLTVVRPIAITDSMVVANTLPQAHPTWVPGTTYADKVRVVDAAGMYVWESLADGNVNHDPVTSPGFWGRVSASNSRAWYDGIASVPCRASGSFSIAFRPGPIGAVGLVGMDGISKVEMKVTKFDTGDTLAERAASLYGVGVDDWYEFFFAHPREYLSEKVFLGIPSYANTEVALTFTGTSAMRLGEVVVGVPYELGDTLQGVGLSTTDYSLQTKDAYGTLKVVKGAYSRVATVPFIFKPERLNRVHQLLRRWQGTPSLWVPSAQSGYEALTTLGLHQRFRIDVNARRVIFASVDLEGLAESDQ